MASPHPCQKTDRLTEPEGMSGKFDRAAQLVAIMDAHFERPYRAKTPHFVRKPPLAEHGVMLVPRLLEPAKVYAPLPIASQIAFLASK